MPGNSGLPAWATQAKPVSLSTQQLSGSYATTLLQLSPKHWGLEISKAFKIPHVEEIIPQSWVSSPQRSPLFWYSTYINAASCVWIPRVFTVQNKKVFRKRDTNWLYYKGLLWFVISRVRQNGGIMQRTSLERDAGKILHYHTSVTDSFSSESHSVPAPTEISVKH